MSTDSVQRRKVDPEDQKTSLLVGKADYENHLTPPAGTVFFSKCVQVDPSIR